MLWLTLKEQKPVPHNFVWLALYDGSVVLAYTKDQHASVFITASTTPHAKQYINAARVQYWNYARRPAHPHA